MFRPYHPDLIDVLLMILACLELYVLGTLLISKRMRVYRRTREIVICLLLLSALLGVLLYRAITGARS